METATGLCEQLLIYIKFYCETISKGQRAVDELQDHDMIEASLRRFV